MLPGYIRTCGKKPAWSTILGVRYCSQPDTRPIASSMAVNPPMCLGPRSIIVSNLYEMIQHPVRPEELHQAKSMLINENTLAESSLTHIAQGLLKRAVLDLPLDEPTIAAEHYLGLNAEQVQAAFAKWVIRLTWWNSFRGRRLNKSDNPCMNNGQEKPVRLDLLAQPNRTGFMY